VVRPLVLLASGAESVVGATVGAGVGGRVGTMPCSIEIGLLLSSVSTFCWRVPSLIAAFVASVYCSRVAVSSRFTTEMLY
jgi:hypothetical protein